MDGIDQFPNDSQRLLRHLRDLILEEAASDPRIGSVTESLKWGQPSFATKSGTPIRLGLSKSGDPAMFVHCQTSVIHDIQTVLPDAFRYEGARAAVPSGDTDDDAIRMFIRAALTYRLR